MDLRAKMIEAGARAMWPPPLRPGDYEMRLAEAALDAMLDCLIENGVEWRRQAYGDPYFNNSGSDIPALLAVLREER